MSVIEIVGGVILLIASLVIVFLTLMQHTHGQGLSGAINGSMGGANNARLLVDLLIEKPLLSNSSFLIDFGCKGNRNLAKEIQKFKKELYTIISNHSHTPYEKVWADSDRNYWMTAEEAKEYGMIDAVLTRKKGVEE
jgi:hypothetical protein